MTGAKTTNTNPATKFRGRKWYRYQDKILRYTRRFYGEPTNKQLEKVLDGGVYDVIQFGIGKREGMTEYISNILSVRHLRDVHE